MAINLSRSVTRPCDILCDITIDDVAISQAIVTVERAGVVMEFDSQKPSLKYNGEGYTCQAMVIGTPSWHTIEDIRADAECLVIAQNPKGEFLCMSILLRTNTTSSPINTFIHSWVPYAVTGTRVPVKLGDEWSLTKMIPPDPGYYAYKGGLPWAPDVKVQWVVFRTMGNIDPNDYALLTKLIPQVPPKTVAINQEIFFNDTSHIAGVPDGKAYMRCKRIKRKGDETATRVTPVVGLATAANTGAATAAQENSTLTWAVEGIYGYVVEAGGGNVLDAVIYGIAILIGVISAYRISSSPRGLTLAIGAQTGAKKILWGWNYLIDTLSLAFVPLVPVLRVFKYTGSLS